MSLPAERGYIVKNVRRIRTICEFAEHFLEFIFPTAGRGEPLPNGADRASLMAPIRTRFWRANFRQFCVKGLDNTQSILCALFLVLTKIGSVKTARHLSARLFRGIFAADDEALLAQGEEDKAKSTEKGR